ncbi:MAG TPA: hypothetical protein VFC63_25655 [Blastocatellia bacterium]|nr:hypothetical protein [Blastocatellia bacterium]
MKRMILVSAILCAAIALSLVIASAKANFSGTFKLDPSKSQMGGGPGGGGGGGGGGGQMGDITLTIVQNGDKIDTTRTSPRGEQKNSYTLDGKAYDFTPQMGGRGGGGGGTPPTGKRTAKWSADGNSVDIAEDTTFTGQDGQAMTRHSTQHWSLSADGKTLTIESTGQGRNGETHSTAVYNKQ